MGSPHALLLPYPLQGHVLPLMELAHCLVDRGFKITLANTEFNHKRVMAALSNKGGDMDGIHLVTVPDGLEPGEDRNDIGRVTQGLLDAMPGCLEEMIRNAGKRGEDRFTCFIVDWTMAWTLEVAHRMGLRCAVFWPSSPGMLLATLSIPKLIEDGIIDEKGIVKRQEMICLSPGMPAMNTAHLYWNCFGDSKTLEIMYDLSVKNNRTVGFANFLLCNSFHEIELPAIFTNAPKLLSVGPIRADRRLGKPAANFWPEDSTCTAWLDEQPPNSVVYVAFGSLAIFNRRQFEELALGLELTGRPFLWVVRPDLTDSSNDAYPHGFRERVLAKQGRIAGWAPQQKVLAHPSIACFVSHCGWNSTTEGVGSGIPVLCWPYFADQFLNESYICDLWRVGLRLTPDESGIISRKQIKSMVEELLGDEELRARALSLKEMVRESVSKGGSSYENLNTFSEAMKGENPVTGASQAAA